MSIYLTHKQCYTVTKNFEHCNILSVIYMIDVTRASFKPHCKLYIFLSFLLSFLFMAQRPLLGQGLPTFEASPSHSIEPLCTSDQSVTETSNKQHTIHTTDIHSTDRIRTRNPYMRAAANPRLRPCGHWDRFKTRHFREKYSHMALWKQSLIMADVKVRSRDLNSGNSPPMA